MDMINTIKALAADFAREDDGAQVVEYALVIALVSIALAIGLSSLASGDPFATFKARIAACLGGTAANTTCLGS